MKILQKDGSNMSISLSEQVLNECDAMARYAFASGIKMPSSLMKSLQIILKNESSTNLLGTELKSNLSESNRKTMESSLPSDQSEQMQQIAFLHESLARIIEPAKPGTILLMQKESQKPALLRLLGPVPLVRRFALIAVIFLISWIGISLCAEVDGVLDWTTQSGWPLLLEELFVLLAAGIGATFAILFQVNRFVVRGTYDPKYDPNYWIRLVLGIVAGMILAFLIPLETSGSLSSMTKPTLAMLGGFSVTIVHRILNQMVTAVESFVRSDTQDLLAAREQVAKSKVEEEKTQDRLELASRLMNLKNKLDSGQKSDVLKQDLVAILDEFMPGKPFEFHKENGS